MRAGLILFAVIALLTTVPSIRADSITVLNPSFEDDAIADVNGYYTYSMSYWNKTGGGAGAWGPQRPGSSVFSTIPDGLNCAYANVGANGSISMNQLLTAQNQWGNTYTLQVDVAGGRADGYPALPWRVQLWAGNQMRAEVFGNPLPTDMWTTETVVYTPLSTDPTLGGNLEIRLVTEMDPAHTAGQGNFDNVRLRVTPAPEPATIAFAAFAGLALRRRR